MRAFEGRSADLRVCLQQTSSPLLAGPLHPCRYEKQVAEEELEKLAEQQAAAAKKAAAEGAIAAAAAAAGGGGDAAQS